MLIVYGLCGLLFLFFYIYATIILQKNNTRKMSISNYMADTIFKLTIILITLSILIPIKIHDFNMDDIKGKIINIIRKNPFIKMFIIFSLYRILLDFLKKFLKKLIVLKQHWFLLFNIVGLFLLNGLLSYMKIIDPTSTKVMVFINSILLLYFLNYLMTKKTFLDIEKTSNNLMYLWIFISFLISK